MRKTIAPDVTNCERFSPTDARPASAQTVPSLTARESPRAARSTCARASRCAARMAITGISHSRASACSAWSCSAPCAVTSPMIGPSSPSWTIRILFASGSAISASTCIACSLNASSPVSSDGTSSGRQSSCAISGRFFGWRARIASAFAASVRTTGLTELTQRVSGCSPPCSTICREISAVFASSCALRSTCSLRASPLSSGSCADVCSSSMSVDVAAPIAAVVQGSGCSRPKAPKDGRRPRVELQGPTRAERYHEQPSALSP